MFRCKTIHPLYKVLIGLYPGICFIFDDPAAVAGACGVFAEHVTFYVIFFIESS